MARMHNPPYPGETLHEDVSPAPEINRVTRSHALNVKAGISADLALRLKAWLDGSACV